MGERAGGRATAAAIRRRATVEALAAAEAAVAIRWQRWRGKNQEKKNQDKSGHFLKNYSILLFFLYKQSLSS